MCQKGFNLRGTPILGVGLVMKHDGATNRTNLGLLGSIGIVLQPHRIADLRLDPRVFWVEDRP